MSLIEQKDSNDGMSILRSWSGDLVVGGAPRSRLIWYVAAA